MTDGIPIDVNQLMADAGLAIEKASHGAITRDVLMAKLKENPRYNRWRLKKIDKGSAEAYWIVACPAKGAGRIFAQTEWDRAHAYLLSEVASDADRREADDMDGTSG